MDTRASGEPTGGLDPRPHHYECRLTRRGAAADGVDAASAVYENRTSSRRIPTSPLLTDRGPVATGATSPFDFGRPDCPAVSARRRGSLYPRAVPSGVGAATVQVGLDVAGDVIAVCVCIVFSATVWLPRMTMIRKSSSMYDLVSSGPLPKYFYCARTISVEMRERRSAPCGRFDW